MIYKILPMNGAKEPWALPTEMTPAPLQIDGIVFVGPIRTGVSMPVTKPHASLIGAHLNKCDHFAIP